MPRLDSEEAAARFGAARVARLATVSSAGRPHLVPVTFVRSRPDTIVFAVDHKPKRTMALARLTHIDANPAVSLLVDVYSEDWSELWWVRADGHAKVLSPDQERELWKQAIQPLAERYEQYRDRPPEGPATVVTVERWSGWEASARRSRPAPASQPSMTRRTRQPPSASGPASSSPP